MICTNIEQSQQLVRLGLDPVTADMCFEMEKGNWTLNVGKKSAQVNRGLAIPAWSLAALLEVMPMVNEGWPVCCKIYGSEKWHVLYHSTAVTPKIDSGEYDTPIEAISLLSIGTRSD